MPGDNLSKNITIKGLAIATTSVSIGVPDGFADPGVQRRTVTVQITPRTFIVNCSNMEIGKDAQELCTFSLPSSLAVTVVSSQPTGLLVSFDPKAIGNTRATAISPGTLCLQALSDNGSVDVTLIAPGYPDAKLTFRLRPAVFFQSAP